MVTGHMVDDEHAALREENARLTAEVTRTVEGFCRVNGHQHLAQDVASYRAHVAALVKVATDLQVSMCAATSLDTSYDVTECLAALTKVLNSPDLAALATREQARDAVMEAAENLRLAHQRMRLGPVLTDERGPSFAQAVNDVIDARAALDAVGQS